MYETCTLTILFLNNIFTHNKFEEKGWGGNLKASFVLYLFEVLFSLVAEGKLYTWGSSSEGQTGHGEEDCNRPKRVQLRGKVVSVDCGYYHMAVVTGELRLS